MSGKHETQAAKSMLNAEMSEFLFCSTSMPQRINATIVSDINGIENQRLRSKEIENRKLINKLTGDLKRQQSNYIKDVVNNATHQRVVSYLPHIIV